MSEHILKTLPDYWDAVSSGAKNFEVRRDDRGFQKGDTLVLRRMETHPIHGLIESRTVDDARRDLHRKITYVLTGGQLGIVSGYVVLGLRK